MALYLGLISGTSMDAIDAVLVRIEADRCTVVHALAVPYPAELRAALFQAIGTPEHSSLDAVGHLDTAIGLEFAAAALKLIGSFGIPSSQVTAIGSHGQTLRHQPRGALPFSWQIGDPNIIAERTGITTVADFRRRDLAAGGEGAPLLPPFHQAMFGSPSESRVVVNIGGIANITWLPTAGPVIGFDTGPGSCLMDGWMLRHRGRAFDRNGEWAASGRPQAALLQSLLMEPYFSRPAPKSTGRELFTPEWLTERLQQFTPEIDAHHVQATLCELTARSICDAVRVLGPVQRVLLCGGGAHNAHLRRRIGELLQGTPVETTEPHGLSVDYVEAAAFAWLAYRNLQGLPGNLPSVTGASHSVVLGAVHPGHAGVTNL